MAPEVQRCQKPKFDFDVKVVTLKKENKEKRLRQKLCFLLILLLVVKE